MTELPEFGQQAEGKKNNSKSSKMLSSSCDMDKWKRSFPNRDIFLRINFLHQASEMLAASPKSDPQCSNVLSHTARNVAQKLVIKLDPTLKRTLCRKCNSLLLSGHSSKVRIRGGNQKHLVVTCLTCRSNRKYPFNNHNKKKKNARNQPNTTVNGNSVA